MYCVYAQCNDVSEVQCTIVLDYFVLTFLPLVTGHHFSWLLSHFMRSVRAYNLLFSSDYFATG